MPSPQHGEIAAELGVVVLADLELDDDPRGSEGFGAELAEEDPLNPRGQTPTPRTVALHRRSMPQRYIVEGLTSGAVKG